MNAETPLTSNLPALPDDLLTAVNTVAAWLAVDDFSADSAARPADVIILAGNSVLSTIDGACQLAQSQGIPLVIAGGIGHSTRFLQQAVARHPRYRVLNTQARTEAAILQAIATRFWHLPPEQIYLETASTNTGQNALFSRAIVEALPSMPTRAVLIQDPVLQRRTDATFRQTWLDSPRKPTFINWPTFIPQLRNTAHGVGFSAKDQDGPWPIDRFVSLLMGEIPRLRDDEQGYGPRGKRFIGHLDIPDSVEQAWQRLIHAPQLSALWLDRVNTH